MTAEKERRAGAESRSFEICPSVSISIPVESPSLAKFMRRERRRFFRNFAWTWAPLGCEIFLFKRGLRRSGAKIGRPIASDVRQCVAVSPGCFSGVRVVLKGVYVVGAEVAFFDRIYFVPQRKASRIASKMLKQKSYLGFGEPKEFRRCESAWSVDYDSANGSLTLF